MEEIWKDVVGYEGLYEVSSRGAVRSLNYRHTRQTQVLKPCKGSFSYLLVTLFKDGQKKNFRVHRLVAEAFVPNPLNLTEINHINEDKTDNRATNLEWCNAKYNSNYGARNMRVAKALSKPVIQYDLYGNFVREWTSASEVHRLTGWSSSGISECCHGKWNTMYGFVWRYSESVPSRTVQDVLF